jgi:hypothetical protein
MGKAQSRQSVDITTEPSKEIQEGSGQLKKIDEAFKENDSSVSVAPRQSAWVINSETVINTLSLSSALGQRE